MSHQISEEQQDQLDAVRELKGKKQKTAITEMIDGDDGWEMLALLQRDDNEKLRKLAVDALAHFGETPPNEVYEALEEALGDDVSGVRNAALKRLAEIQPRGTVSVRLVNYLNVKKAREVLAAYGELAIPALCDTMEKGDAKARKYVLDVFVTMGNVAKTSASARDALLGAIGDDDKKVRKAAFEAIDALGVDMSESKEAMTTATQQGDDNAATVVKGWGEDALEVFEDMLQFDDPKLRKFALVHMVDLIEHLEADDDYEALIGALSDEKPAVRRAALDFFAALPFAVEDALEAIDGLYDEPQAMQILAKYGEEALPTYKDMIRSHSPKDRRSLISVLPKLKKELIEELAAPLLEMTKAEYDHQALMLLFATLPKLKLPADDVAAAVDGHMDHWDNRICEAACELVKGLGKPTRESTWHKCRLDSSVKRHLHRLGATFEPPDVHAHNSEVDGRMSEALFDLQHGVKFAHQSWFNTFNSYGQTSLDLSNNRVFTAPKRNNSEGETVDCVEFASTDYRRFGLPLDEDRKDPTVYMTDEYESEYETSWAYSSLSYFLQHFERPKDL